MNPTPEQWPHLYPPDDPRHVHDTDAGGNCRNRACTYNSDFDDDHVVWDDPPTPEEEAAAELREWMEDSLRMLGASQDYTDRFLAEYDRLTAQELNEGDDTSE